LTDFSNEHPAFQLLRTTPTYNHSFNEESHSSLSLSESKPFSFQSDSQINTTNSVGTFHAQE
jgi:hypothetical protein